MAGRVLRLVGNAPWRRYAAQPPSSAATVLVENASGINCGDDTGFVLTKATEEMDRAYCPDCLRVKAKCAAWDAVLLQRRS